MFVCLLSMRKKAYADHFKKKKNHLSVALRGVTASLRKSGRILVSPSMPNYLEKNFLNIFFCLCSPKLSQVYTI